MKNRNTPSDQDYFNENSLKYYRDLKASLATRYEEGMEKGMEKGREEGRKEGRKEGMAEGMEKVALKMIQQNEPIERIMVYTGLTEEQIEILKNSK